MNRYAEEETTITLIRKYKYLTVALIIMLIGVALFSSSHWSARKMYDKNMEMLTTLETMTEEKVQINIISYARENEKYGVIEHESKNSFTDAQRQQLFQLLHTLEFDGIFLQRNYLNKFLIPENNGYTIRITSGSPSDGALRWEVWLAADSSLNHLNERHNGEPSAALKDNKAVLNYLDELFAEE